MSRRRLVMVLAAITLALIGMFVIVAYVGSAERRALEGTVLRPVLVATEDIDMNTPASALVGRVSPVDVPERLLQPDAVRNLDNLGDRVAEGPIRAGEQIVERQFVDPATVRGPASEIAPGNEIVSIALESQRAVGGQISAGDRVSVVISIGEAEVANVQDTSRTVTSDTLTGQVLSNIKVTGVTGGVTDESGESGGVVLVSLEVDESEAETVIFGMEHGAIWLTRNGDNVDQPDIEQRSPDNIFDVGRRGS